MELSAIPIAALAGSDPLSGNEFDILAALLSRLRGRGLKTALLLMGRRGDDETTAFRLGAAGADVCRLADGGPRGEGEAERALRRLAASHDLVLAAGRGLPELCFQFRLDDQKTGADAERRAVELEEFLFRQWRRPPVVGCVLIGGRSSRMGRPKQLLPTADGSTWLARAVDVLSQVCSQVVAAGRGELAGLDLPQLPDATGVSGPLAGVLAARRWQPWASLLVCACDMPELSLPALDWLLEQRRPGAWAVIPQVDGRHQPLLALYDFRILPALEEMARQGQWRMTSLLSGPGVVHPEPAAELRPAWRNVNRPEQL